MNEDNILIDIWHTFVKQYINNPRTIISCKNPDSIMREMDFDLSDEKIDNLEEQLPKILEQVALNSPWSQHPSLMGYLYANPDTIGLIGDWLISTINTNVHTYQASPVFSITENIVCKHLIDLAGFSSDADGVFCPGGSYSNMLAIFMAKKSALDNGANPEKLVLFTSEQSHYSIDKSASLVGIPDNRIRKISCDSKGRMKADDLVNSIKFSLNNDEYPFLVCATVGTTVLGGIDPIDEISDLLKNYNDIWLHVDGAWGGPILFSEKYRTKLRGIENADSFTIDFHKALGAPILCSVLLSSNKAYLTNMFNVTDDYLFHDIGNHDELEIGRKTHQCGRRGDAFKVWLMWKIRGRKYFENHIERAFFNTDYMINKLKSFDEFWIYNEKPDSWNVCFWYVPDKIRKLNNIDNCNDSEKQLIGEITKEIYNYFYKQGNIQINYSSLDGYPPFIRLIAAGRKIETSDIDRAINIIRSIGCLMTSNLESLLTSGGDERLDVERNGFSKTFSSPVPVPGIIERSSCTSSTITEREHQYLNDLLHKLKTGLISFDDLMFSIHNRIRKLLEAGNDTSIITIPSGTDAEFISLFIAKACAGIQNNFINLITGMGEIGSRSAIAAEGKHFCFKTPEGIDTLPDKRLKGIGDIRIKQISLRDQQSGKPLKNTSFWIKDVEKELKLKNSFVLLHILESSKLGYRLDLMGEIEDLIAHFPDRLIVVVDACQSRTDIRRIRQYLRLGCMIMITGSKFEQSPPFSGAVIIPPQITDKFDQRSFDQFPSSLKHYVSFYDVSGPIKSFIDNNLNNWMNFGLMLRWMIGLDNWEKYRQIDENVRTSCITEWVNGVLSEINQFKNILLFSGGEYQFGSVGDINTIISIKLMINGNPLKVDDVRQVYHYMASDISGIIPGNIIKNEYYKNLLCNKYVLGQPVDLGNFAVLRIALGSRLVQQMTSTSIDAELKYDREILDKINIILKYLEGSS